MKRTNAITQWTVHFCVIISRFTHRCYSEMQRTVLSCRHARLTLDDALINTYFICVSSKTGGRGKRTIPQMFRIFFFVFLFPISSYSKRKTYFPFIRLIAFDVHQLFMFFLFLLLPFLNCFCAAQADAEFATKIAARGFSMTDVPEKEKPSSVITSLQTYIRDGVSS